ncbi:signal peptide peptidase SppA [Candidatus Woesearchaeota archaeon CG10_big_fil_rev_8_21_14_0_10_37_12]|nr:MAG: signal peptide peptidase SppA [Candidatus Woesearchaeota archaeon CG10_big_fil_rev_8_21_14_0_10_37_12]
MAKKRSNKQKTELKQLSGWQVLRTSWRIVSFGLSALMFLIFILFAFAIFGAFIPVEELHDGNIAIIPLNGAIYTEQESSLFEGIESQDIIDLIEKANENEKIKAIIFEINSPGGSPVATDEIAQAIKKTNKTTVAVIREVGASGAYWVATATDTIFANRMSLTGSIGVRASRLEFAGLLDDYNVTYRRLVAGHLKDAGSPYKEMTAEEQQLFQRLLDNLHTEFIHAVAENRNLPEEQVRQLATGFVYIGSEAKELGLIDAIGGKEEALHYIEEQLNIDAKPIEYTKPKTFFEQLGTMQTSAFTDIGKGMGSVFLERETQISFS